MTRIQKRTGKPRWNGRTTTDRLLTLDMALCADKRTMEQRVRGVFARRRSARFARVLTAILCLVLGIGCFTTACVPAREAPGSAAAAALANADGSVLLDGGAQAQSRMEPAPLNATPETAECPLYERLGVPRRWRFDETSADGRMRVVADTDISLPDVAALPVVSAELREFTEEDLKKVTAVLFGEKAAVTDSEQDTREWMERLAADIKKFVDELDAGTSKNKLASWEKSVRGQYAYYSEMAKTAPPASEKREKTLAFTELPSHTGDTYSGFRGDTVSNGQDYTVTASNSGISVFEAQGGSDGPMRSGAYRSVPEGVTLTKELAMERASAIAAQITDELTLCHVYVTGRHFVEPQYARPWAWQCVFMRAVNGAPSVYDSRNVNSDIATDIDGGVPNEMLEIAIDDLGVASLRWANPMAVTGVTQSDAQLLPFSQIAAAIPEQLRTKLDHDVTRSQEQTQIQVAGVRLGLMRIGKPGAAVYTFEPVWSFFTRFAGEAGAWQTNPDLIDVLADGDPTHWNSLTVSAIDGRIVDRNRGY